MAQGGAILIATLVVVFIVWFLNQEGKKTTNKKDDYATSEFMMDAAYGPTRLPFVEPESTTVITGEMSAGDAPLHYITSLKPPRYDLEERPPRNFANHWDKGLLFPQTLPTTAHSLYTTSAHPIADHFNTERASVAAALRHV